MEQLNNKNSQIELLKLELEDYKNKEVILSKLERSQIQA